MGEALLVIEYPKERNTLFGKEEITFGDREEFKRKMQSEFKRAVKKLSGKLDGISLKLTSIEVYEADDNSPLYGSRESKTPRGTPHLLVVYDDGIAYGFGIRSAYMVINETSRRLVPYVEPSDIYMIAHDDAFGDVREVLR